MMNTDAFMDELCALRRASDQRRRDELALAIRAALSAELDAIHKRAQPGTMVRLPFDASAESAVSWVASTITDAVPLLLATSAALEMTLMDALPPGWWIRRCCRPRVAEALAAFARDDPAIDEILARLGATRVDEDDAEC